MPALQAPVVIRTWDDARTRLTVLLSIIAVLVIAYDVAISIRLF